MEITYLGSRLPPTSLASQLVFGFSQAKIKIKEWEEEKPSGQTSQVFVSAWNAINCSTCKSHETLPTWNFFLDFLLACRAMELTYYGAWYYHVTAKLWYDARTTPDSSPFKFRAYNFRPWKTETTTHYSPVAGCEAIILVATLGEAVLSWSTANVF